MKSQQPQLTYVELKTVTWCKDSHDLFDYESKNVNYMKTRIDSTSKVFKDGSEITVKNLKEAENLIKDKTMNPEPNFLFTIIGDHEKNERFYIKADENISKNYDDYKNNSLFLIIRSLKQEDGTQRGYNLELGDIIRLGRIEYRVLEFQTHPSKISTLLMDNTPKSAPFKIMKKEIIPNRTNTKRECRICFMDENDSEEILVNPCNCKGTSEYVHIKCVQDWINSKMKKKFNQDVACYYWKKLHCEVCKVPLPDIIENSASRYELVPFERPNTPYILFERVFYDKTKENGDQSRILILISLINEDHQIKLGRGHECDIRENDISVSRIHAHIKYQNGNFTLIDNNSKFGTLVYLRRSLEIERRKIALQIGRTVLTFSLKHLSISNIPTLKNPLLIDKLNKIQFPKNYRVKPYLNGGISRSKQINDQQRSIQNGSEMNARFSSQKLGKTCFI